MTGDERKAINERLERIRMRAKGILTPAAVVADARSESSPLHSQFTWDDSEAARLRRLDEARMLIRSVRLEVTNTDVGIAAPFYVRDLSRPADKQGYASIVEVRDDATIAAETLQYEFDRAIGCIERSVEIANVLGMSDQVRELLGRVIGVYNSIPDKAARKKRRKAVA